VLPHELLATARFLIAPGSPTTANCRRAASSVYYSIFHCLSKECADLFIGSDAAKRSKAAWNQVYRSVDHAPAKGKCNNKAMMATFPTGIQDFAEQFSAMQDKRHKADYDINASILKSEVENDIIVVQRAIKDFKACKVKDRRAFCAYILLKDRGQK
jgi:hypothetical protein